jgi:hypothetical protein
MPLTLIGKTFTVAPKFQSKAFFAEKCNEGKIAYVVRRSATGDDRGDSELYFKCYNHITNTTEPPTDSDEWVYIKCKDLMSSDLKRRMMTWDPDPDKQPVQRRKRQKRSVWAYEKTKKALYDTSEDETVKSPRTPRAPRRRKTALPKADEVFDDNTIPKDSAADVATYRKKLRANMDVRLASIRATHKENHPHLYVSQASSTDAPKTDDDAYVALSDVSDEYDDDFESEDEAC